MSFLKNSGFMQMILQWGGVFAFVCVTGATTEQALLKVRKEHVNLARQMAQIEESSKEALKVQEQLKAQINSQSDVAWIELVLKRELGLIPEGQIKILFMPSI